jgi:hypothetical protein
MTKKLSKQAEDYLIRTTGRLGARVEGHEPALSELELAGLTTRHDCLTVKGLNERDRIMTRRLDEAFG